MKPKPELPRGLHWRGDSIVASFALKDVRCRGGGHVPDCECGKIERRSLGEVSVSYADQQLKIFKRAVDEGKYEKRQPRPEPTPKPKPVLVGDLLEPYLRNYRNAGKKAEWRQRTAWKNLKPTFGEMLVTELTTDAIEKYISSRRDAAMQPNTPAWLARNGTTNRELALLKAMLTHGTTVTPRRVDTVPHFPTKLKESPARKGFITDKEYGVLAPNAKPLCLRALIACAYSFGFRRGELLHLRVEQVDFFDGWIELWEGETKTDDARKIKMTAEVFQLMKACCEGKDKADYVFTRDDGARVCDPRDDWYALCVAAGLGQYVPAKRANGEEYSKYVGLNLHDFRRSAVRNLIRSGVSQNVAMKVSGHRTPEVFRRYDIIDDPDLADATAKLERSRQVSAASTTTDTKTSTPASDSALLSPQIPRN